MPRDVRAPSAHQALFPKSKARITFENPLTTGVDFGYQQHRKVMLLVIAITEATTQDESAEAFVERTADRQSKSRSSGPSN
ncbi:MAG TPA: hypothetical protein VGR23_08145 [Candidatus Dormibacteraeota bacterium]|jgi:hypothetical protein|nr:hypothetical protein [Candidatus Dormibacteraeota bacterium]